VLETLVRQTLALMNEGRPLDEVLSRVKAPAELLARPWLRPKYDDPEFVVRNIWHLFGGWFDGNPAHLKPATMAALARELATLAGGADRLAERAALLAEAGETRTAAHLIELASHADPVSADIQAIRTAVYRSCIEAETSLIGKAIFAVYQREAKARLES
jgi:alkyl sulfatase BDS1-like metallo-beta-lactamase superfamily hydrolase